MFGDSVGLGGFAHFGFENVLTGETRETLKKNTLTTLGKLFMLQSAPSRTLLNPTGIQRGTLYRRGGPCQIGANSAYQYKQTLGDSLTVYLLNTSENLTEANTALPVYTPQGIDQGKLTGFANLRRTPTSTKEGVIEPVYDSFMVTDNAAVSRWKFDQTQANGQITHVAIGLNVSDNPYGKIRIAKGILDTETLTFGGNNSLSSYFIAPGVPNVTADNEILVCCRTADGTTSDSVFNMETGVLTGLDAQDPRYNLPLGQAGYPQYVVNGQLFYIVSGTLYKLVPATKTRENIGSCASGAFFPVGNKVYYHTSSNTSFSVYNAQTNSGDSSVSFTFPTSKAQYFYATTASTLFRNCTILKTVGGKYVLSPDSGAGTQFGPKYELLIDDILNLDTTSMEFTVTHEARLAEFNVNENIIQILGPSFNTDTYVYINGIQTEDTRRNTTGVFLSKPAWVGNMISVLKLDSPETKTDSEIVHVSYGYLQQ